jgi:hypothetical protein
MCDLKEAHIAQLLVKGETKNLSHARIMLFLIPAKYVLPCKPRRH